MVTRADLVAVATAQHHRHYLDTGNAIHVWAAYVQARRLKVTTLPVWILDYFDQAAERLIAPGGTANPKATAAALGLQTVGGGPSARERAVTAKRDAAIRQSVALAQTPSPEAREQGERGLTGTRARTEAAERVNRGTHTVRNIVYRKPRK